MPLRACTEFHTISSESISFNDSCRHYRLTWIIHVIPPPTQESTKSSFQAQPISLPVAQSRFYIRVNCVLRYGWKQSHQQLHPSIWLQGGTTTACCYSSLPSVSSCDARLGFDGDVSCRLRWRTCFALPKENDTDQMGCLLGDAISSATDTCYWCRDALRDF